MLTVLFGRRVVADRRRLLVGLFAQVLVRRLDEAVLVDPGVRRKRRDQTNVRTLWRLDRADPAVVRRVNVPDFEASAFAAQTARSKGGQAALVRDFGQGVGLVHELRQLGATEEFLHNGRGRLVVDEVVRQQGVHVLELQTLADGTLDTQQTDAVLVFEKLTDSADAAVTQMVNVVDLTVAVFQLQEVADRLEDVVLGQRALFQGGVKAKAFVQLQTTNRTQIVAVRVEEEVVEQHLGGFDRWWITRTQAFIDLEDRFVLAGDLVGHERVAERGVRVHLVHEQDRHIFNAAVEDLFDESFVEVGVDGDNDVAVTVPDVFGQNLADHVFDRKSLVFQAGLLHLTDRTLGNTAVLLDVDFAGFRVGDIGGSTLAAEELVVELLLEVTVTHPHAFLLIEVVEQLFVGEAESLEQHGCVQLTAAVNADVEDVFGVELEVKPATAVRDNPGRVEQLAGRTVAALVVVEKHTSGTMQLRYDNALGTVDDESAGLGHQRNFAEVDVLLFHVPDRFDPGFLINVPNDQADHDFQGSREAHATLPALVDGILRFFEGIADELDRRRLLEVLNRKDRPEHPFQTRVLALVRVDFHLQKLAVAVALNFDQIRHIDGGGDFGKTLPRPRIAGCQGGHRVLLSPRG